MQCVQFSMKHFFLHSLFKEHFIGNMQADDDFEPEDIKKLDLIINLSYISCPG